MPISLFEGKLWTSKILFLLRQQTALRRVLDVGVGIGTYCQYYRDQLPETEWVGIEAWCPYVAEYKLQEYYDQIVVADARYVNWAKLGTFDIAFFGDILEHMSKADALQLFQEVSQIARFIIISIPIVHTPQGDFGGNPFERHVKDDWTHEEVLATFPHILASSTDSVLGVYVAAVHPADQVLLASEATLQPVSLYSQAEWYGSLSEGSGTVQVQQDDQLKDYSFAEFPLLFKEQQGDYPKALLGGALAFSFLMAFLESFPQDYLPPLRLVAAVSMAPDAGTNLVLSFEAEIPDLSLAQFTEKIEAAKRTCPIYKSLPEQQISLKTKLLATPSGN